MVSEQGPGAMVRGEGGGRAWSFDREKCNFGHFDFRALSWQDRVELGSANESFY